MSTSVGEDASAREFAKWAREFCRRVEDPGSVTPDDFHRELARRLSRLYTAAMELPDVEPSGAGVEDLSPPELPQLGEKLYAQYYRTVFNPLDLEEETLYGDLLDDIGDIHKDLWCGLVLWERGTPESQADAVWQWRFGFRAHWGKHAVDALTVLHQLWSDGPC